MVEKWWLFLGVYREAPVLSGTEGRVDLLFGLCCKLPTEQGTHLSVEREMSPTWLPQECITSLIGQPSLCSAGMAGAGALRREAMMHSCVWAWIGHHPKSLLWFSKQSGICSKGLSLRAGSKVPSQVPGGAGVPYWLSGKC